MRTAGSRVEPLFLPLLLGLAQIACLSEKEVEGWPTGQTELPDAWADGYPDGTSDPASDVAPQDALGDGEISPDGTVAADIAEVEEPGDLDQPGDEGLDQGPDYPVVQSCYFDYDQMFASSKALGPPSIPETLEVNEPPASLWPGVIAHDDPPPPGTTRVPVRSTKADEEITMPTYVDDMPLFERGLAWSDETRCYETPQGAVLLTEAQAYDLYRDIAELTTGVAMDDRPEVRTVVGLRGAYPGTFQWHGNTPDHFNDTLVLLWIDDLEVRHVREFPVHTDVGKHDFGINNSSSLRPNRRYSYIDDWHNTYNALRIDEEGYRVRNDTNDNGHWDSDRNGWLPPFTGNDYDRIGSGHNIHMASVDGPLGQALVDRWSAGCQAIPGIANWTEFITHAWTRLSDPVNYFLIDVRDIAVEVWQPCSPDGSHRCPFHIDQPDITLDGDTSTSETREFDVYNCSSADESGPEDVYVFTIDSIGTLDAWLTIDDPLVDVDIHLLDGDDPDACLARGHWSLSYDITPGRYFLVADTYAEDGEILPGAYTLDVELY